MEHPHLRIPARALFQVFGICRHFRFLETQVSCNYIFIEFFYFKNFSFDATFILIASLGYSFTRFCNTVESHTIFVKSRAISIKFRAIPRTA